MLKTLKQHASHVTKHLHTHKHKYLFGTFGSFGIVKTILFFAGVFGLISLGSSFAANGIPSASNVAITGNITASSSYIGELLSGTYTYTNGGWEILGVKGFSNGGLLRNSLAVDNSGTLYIAYQDVGNSNKATVMKFNGAAWELVGTAGFSSIDVPFISMAIGSDNTPYVAYQEGTNGKATVMKFNGAAWEALGTTGFSSGGASNISLALDTNNVPYLAYKDLANVGKATVMKFNGAAWEFVGSPAFSSGQIDYNNRSLDLTLDSNNVPYVAYRDYVNGDRATVMKFNGAAWETVGAFGFSNGQVDYTSLAFDNNNLPYVAFQDGANSNKATVMKFNGSAWKFVGADAFSSGDVMSTSLSIGSDGIPYLAYTDGGNNYGATVMKFNGTSWEVVGTPGFSDGGAYQLSLALDNNNLPYVAYRDVTAPSYGATVMALTPTIEEGTSLYQWYRDSVAITGTTTLAYTPTLDDLNTTLTFSVTPISLSGIQGDTVTSNGISIVPPAATNVAIVGNPYVGNNILTGQYTYVYSDLDPEGNSTYQWYRDSVAITGATALIYTPTLADLNTTLTFSVTPLSLSGVEGDTVTSNGISIVPPVITNVVIVGDPYIGENLQLGSYAYTYSDPEGNSLYQWYRDSVAITGATGINYTVTAQDAGKTLFLEITPISLGGVIGNNVNSNSISIALGPVVADVSITGGLDIGQVLTGSYTFTDGPAGGNWTVLGNSGFSSGTTYYNSLVFDSNDVPYVAYRDENNGYGLSVMRFSGSVWEIVGKVNAFDNAAGYISMVMSNSNYPYISFADHTNSDKLSVAQYDVAQSKWVWLGAIGFSDSSINTLSPLAINSNGVPYVVYQDAAYGNRMTVKKYDAGSHDWLLVGDAGFTPDRAGYVSIAIGSGNIPYVAFQDSQVAGMISVMKYDAGQNKWNFVGQQGFSSKNALYISLRIDDNGAPYVLYADPDYNNNLSVMKYDAGQDKWNFVGSPGFSSGGITDYPSFEINSDNVPYVAYQDIAGGTKASVMTYDSGSNQRVFVGGQSFTYDLAMYLSLDFDSNDVPYVAFQDKSTTMKATVMTFSEVEATSGNYLYQWYRNGVAITGATGIDYTVTIDDLGKTISFEVIPYSSTFVPGVPVQSDVSVPGPICGNGLVEILETCDEGDAVNGQLGHCNLTCNGTTTQIVGNGGAGATVVSQDQCPANRDCSSSYYDSLCGPCSETGSSHASASGDITDSSYSDELNQAYQRAFAHGITTMATIQKANMEGLLIRSHMAKMISNFAIKVLDKKPDTTLSCLFADTNNESAEMKFYIKTACQLGLMGRESDGKTTKKNFEPAGIITRAQFATVLSRLLYGDTYNSSDFTNRYVKHLQALHTKGIINDISTPNANEIRGYLMLMLMRAQK